ncbi:hypothetical protein MVEN_00283600 [Mycena venus]|uniref:Uncharacterized protein n=1 Tax=Mycena venus TaxID=2733690 RepID=A0A8H7DE18_9AGAR|nr:hypothetical protein MVEN_00283600 [Mycena venus]
MVTRLPPAAKLSLAVRKNVREDYENKKESFDKELSDLLGAPWTFDFDPLAIYPYAESQHFCKEQPGTVLKLYVEGVMTSLKWLVEAYGEAGKKELNEIAHAHTIQLDVGEPEQIVRSTDSGTAVVDGKLVILFKADGFGSNPHWALGEASLFPAVNAAPGSQPMTFLARLGISKNYAEKADPAKKKFKDMLQKDITLDPNFEEVFAKLLEESKRPGNSIVDTPEWQLQFGRYVANYFDAMAYQMECLGFGTDEMLREGFNEGVESGVIKVRIVDALKRQRDCEVEIEDGVLYLQTTLEKWGWNPNNIGYNIGDLL